MPMTPEDVLITALVSQTFLQVMVAQTLPSTQAETAVVRGSTAVQEDGQGRMGRIGRSTSEGHRIPVGTLASSSSGRNTKPSRPNQWLMVLVLGLCVFVCLFKCGSCNVGVHMCLCGNVQIHVHSGLDTVRLGSNDLS